MEELVNESLNAAGGQSLTDFGIRFGINFLVIFILVRLLYYPKRKNRDFLFTFFLFNIINFLICFLLSSAKLKIGFAFGLFAIFSILRYRTVTVPVREMGYFFISVTLGIINALTSNEQGMVMLIIANIIILSVAWFIDYKLRVTHENHKEIIYDRIDLISPDKRVEMIKDLCERTGLNIHRVEFSRIDFFKDTATIFVFYNDFKNDAEIATVAREEDD
jgi:hypothetical protein